MADVIYLLSSLPYIDLLLHVDGVYEHIDSFFEDCQVLDDHQAQDVILAIKDPKNSNLPIAKEWAEYEYSIKNELARKRWQHMREGAYQSVLVHDSIPVSTEAYDILTVVNHEHNPYIREKTIIEQKWKILDFMESRFQFQLENIIIYGWKLQLYYSYRNLTEERGKTQWNTLITALSEKSGFSISSIDGGFNE